MPARSYKRNVMTLGVGLCIALVCRVVMAQAPGEAAFDSAMQGRDVKVLVELAARYETGADVDRDFIKSNALYCRAAALGDTEALLKLARVYSAGRGVGPDEGLAALLVRKAAALGNEHAQQLLDHVSRRSEGVTPACLDEPPPAVATQEPSVFASAAPRNDLERMVQRWAPEYSLDPELVMALIAVESRFDANAMSPKNAQGLMQLIPATARRFGVKNAFDPVENLKGGLAYLKWLMAYFKGQVTLVLAAYNAGEESVQRYGGIPPYRETREYVKRITSVYRNATHPYAGELASPSKNLARSKRAE